MADEPKLCSRFVQLLKHRLCNVWLGVVTEKSWALCADQCWLQALQFSVDLINLLSSLLRCNGLPEIQKAVVDQTSSRPPNADHDLFGASLSLESALDLPLGPITELLITGCCIKSTFHHISQSNQEMVPCWVE